MKKILFIYDHQNPKILEKDGLWCALNLLEKDFEITRTNIVGGGMPVGNFDFVLGWGGFTSKVDDCLQTFDIKKGLCLSAYFPTNETAKNYDIIFCETENTRMWLDTQGIKQTKHAFGINTNVFRQLFLTDQDIDINLDYPKIWDNISVGAFTKWHRQDRLYDLPGQNLAVGHLDIGNIQESFNYIANLCMRIWTISTGVSQETLAKFYNMSRKCILTADFGQERACLEARACGIPVEVPDDNPKLKELLTSPIWDIGYYATALKEGIESCS